MNNRIPDQMTVVELHNPIGVDGVELSQRPVPRPTSGEVLVKVAAAPINPSDLMFLRGMYGVKKALPAVPGFEGSGVVVDTGGGVAGKRLVGRRVAFGATGEDGTWSEYIRVPARFCFPLPEEISLEQGAMTIVNPITAWALVEIARKGGHAAVVQTAAASSLGRMIVRLCQRFDLPLINVVRRQEQVDLLHGMGARYVLNSSDPKFDAQLAEVSKRLGATIAFDAISGEMAGRVLGALPRKGRLIVYGALSEQPAMVNPGSLIFEDKHVEGFWLSSWLGKTNPIRQLLTGKQVLNMLKDDLHSDIQARFPLSEVRDALRLYESNMTGGKVLLVAEDTVPE